MKISCNLSKKGDIDNLISKLEEYKNNIKPKTKEFVDRLMDVGINIAKVRLGEYESSVLFEKQIGEENKYLLIARDSEKIVSGWYTDKKLTHYRSYEISPILMAEFGSGWLSVVLSDIPGVGQGTMPNSYGHAMDENGWVWYDKDGTKHHSIGEAPTFPMYTAAMEMMQQVDRIAKEVFSDVGK